jgi:hypothetical protein
MVSAADDPFAETPAALPTRAFRAALFAAARDDASARMARLTMALSAYERDCPTGARAEATRREIETARADIALLARLAKDATGGRT